MIVVPTVPHTGTHFMRDHLLADVECYVRHPHPLDEPKLRELLEAGNPCLVPMRDRWEVTVSWIRHDKNPGNYLGWSLPEWFEQLDALIWPYSPLILHIDDLAARDHELAIINNTLGLELETDWPIIRQPDE